MVLHAKCARDNVWVCKSGPDNCAHKRSQMPLFLQIKVARLASAAGASCTPQSSVATSPAQSPFEYASPFCIECSPQRSAQHLHSHAGQARWLASADTAESDMSVAHAYGRSAAHPRDDADTAYHGAATSAQRPRPDCDSVSVGHTRSSVSSGAAAAPQTAFGMPSSIAELAKPSQEPVPLRLLLGDVPPQPSTTEDRRLAAQHSTMKRLRRQRSEFELLVEQQRRRKRPPGGVYVPPPPLQRRASDGSFLGGSPVKQLVYSRSSSMPADTGVIIASCHPLQIPQVAAFSPVQRDRACSSQRTCLNVGNQWQLTIQHQHGSSVCRCSAK